MSHNVKGIQRFCGCDKGNRKNVPEKKRTKGEARLGFFVGQARVLKAKRIAYVIRRKNPRRSITHGRVACLFFYLSLNNSSKIFGKSMAKSPL
ncbi:MAG: hypothetical protein Ta2B_09780 [Termitinemataceae bacterium]|nr:MAG: hypothetical protein Ta2B_09780 [Termitinemataceae bacterium]